jgi:ATP-dependent exoDNAse (exonuclease V) beta subunit
MAVLVRSALRSVPLLRRALSAAGVPVVVAGDELPLAAEPAVAPLLAALRCAEEPRQLSPELARTLLLSPLGGLDPVDLRRLGRLLRDRARAAAPGVMPPASAELVRRVLVADEPMPAAPSRLSDPLRRLAGLLRDAGATLRSGGAAEQALWQLWSGTDWPARLLAASAAGGQAGKAADRDLDAVLALFDTFARAEERRPGRGASNLLAEIAAQQIPAEGLAERGPPGAGVRLLTAHRAKGLEWELVVVAGVQEEAWPDLRRRGSLLGAERLGPDGEVPPPSLPELLADERRLFYVAVSRARRRLLVTAVAAEGTDGMRPSRFLDELGVGAVEHPVPAPPFSLPGLVARLRLAATDPEEPPALRAAAVRGLARLAADAPPDSGAHPDRWWGLTERSEPGQPIHDPAQPVRLSATSLAGVEECPLRWFLRHEVRAEPPTGAALAFGGLLHALADAVGSGRAAPDARQLIRQLDRVWSAVAFEAPWRSEQERVEAGRALQRLLDWHAATRGRRLVATEVPFEVSLRVAGRDVLLRGFVDRLELDDADAVHVVDFKTGRRPPAATQAAGNLQLGCYQLAVASGGFDRHPALPAAPRPAGAELVWLRSADRDGLPRVHRQAGFGDSGPPGWLTEALEQTVLRLAAEEFPARPGRYCARCTFRACCPAQPDGRQLFA